jgi:hypothetical protein
MRPEPTTAQELGSIVLRTTVGPTIGQVYGCIGEHTTVGPSLGEPTGRLLGASTGLAFGYPDHGLGPSTARESSAPLAQEISPGTGGASRSQNSVQHPSCSPAYSPRSERVR